MGGLFSVPKNPNPGIPSKILDNPEQYPDPNAVLQLQAGMSNTPLYGGGGVRQLGSVAQAQRMMPAGAAGDPAQSILRTLWNSGQMSHPGAPLQKAVAPGAAAVNTLANHGVRQAVNGANAAPIGAMAPGMPSTQDIQQAAAIATPQAQVIRTKQLPR